jgi:hypothetical protein
MGVLPATCVNQSDVFNAGITSSFSDTYLFTYR